ncbi:MAG: tol-pal system protein [Archangium gephyra]|uniref:Tol-pal system protein n=1 Tax=Archangium gephyra TaxID=48 RepID=A0A2W5VE43_9BACT|nr:MAG: tol-pal system protein [Archangium gephyra]
MIRRLVAGLAVLSLAGCFFPADRGRVVENRLDGLQADNQKLRTELQETRTKLEEATAQLQTALDQLDRASRTTGANIGVKVDTALQDVAVLRGQVETQSVKLQEIETKIAAGPSITSTPEPRKEEFKRPDDPKEFLKLADEKAKAGEVATARQLYAEFMKKWPRDEQIGEAHYQLGESFFGEQKCREALYEYGKVIQEFSKTRSAPMAYLHSSECFKQLKMTDEARLALEELVKSYPKSDAAKTAKTRLADLRKKK